MISLEASATAYSMLRLRPACIACQDQWQLWPRRSAHSVRHKPSPQCCREAGGAGAAGGAAGAMGALGAEGVFEAVLEIAGEGEGSGFAACVVAFGGVGGPGKLRPSRRGSPLQSWLCYGFTCFGGNRCGGICRRG